MEARKITPLNINVFNAVDLWPDPAYAISKLFDGFECQNFPISCFLEWSIPTQEEIETMDSWNQDEALYLKETAIVSTLDENNQPTIKEGDLILIFIKGTAV